MNPGYVAATRRLVCPDNSNIRSCNMIFSAILSLGNAAEIQLVELCGTFCRDKMMQECDANCVNGFETRYCKQ